MPEAQVARRTLKNSVYGAVGFLWPLMLGLFTSPYVVGKLGADLYGVLSIVGITLGFFGFLDFGMGGAAVRQIAAYYQKEEHDNVNRVVSAVMAFYVMIGLVAGALLLALTDVFVAKLLGIPPALANTARAAFYIAAPSFLTSLIVGALFSIPTALQRYDITTKVNLVVGTINAVLTVGVLALGYGIVAVMAAGLVVTLLMVPVAYVIGRRLVPSLSIAPRWDAPMLRQLFSFGGYFLLSSIGVMLLYQLDKLLVGHFLGVAAVTYYVVPGNLAQKIQGFVAATTAVVFPMSAALFESQQKDKLLHLYAEGTRLVQMLITAVAVPLALFAGKFLYYWMGPDIAAGSSVVMVILVVTYAMLALSSIAWGIANGSGRAKINALFTLSIAAIDISFFLVLVRPFGVAGAAGAYLVSAVLGVPVLIYYIERYVLGLSGFAYLTVYWRIGVVGVAQAALAFAMLPLCTSLATTATAMVASVASFAAIYVLFRFTQDGDKRLLGMVVERLRG
jgi:O-antigen/teichoic acid export membrane protein